MSELGNKIKQLRGELSQLAFSKRVDLSHRTITKIEAGDKPKRANVIQIADRLRLGRVERLALLVLWLKAEVGEDDFEALNVNPVPAAMPRADTLDRLYKAASPLSTNHQEHLVLACRRPEVMNNLTALNDLYDKISRDKGPAREPRKRKHSVPARGRGRRLGSLTPA